MKIVVVLLISLLSLMPALADEPIRVMVIGTFHMNNPGRDKLNVSADDMLAPKRQAELAAVADGLARFRPTMVAVELQEKIAGEQYARYHTGALASDRSEKVQIGFRLAGKMGLSTVYGIDVLANFPYEAVDAWGKAHGKEEFLAEAWKEAQVSNDAVNAELAKDTIGATLRFINDPDRIARGHEFYREMLSMGRGEEQPGVALLTAWYERNFRICANLVQHTKPGDRVVVVYGAGHAFLLRQCIREMPGYQLVEANDFLPK